uniref:Uncharacterized protein n=1 Tax=viral metagenome TaxID=1070528 RepID=A0A6C0DXG9_9ZZZZ
MNESCENDSLYEIALKKNNKRRKTKKFDNPKTDDKGFFTVQGDYYENNNASISIDSPSENMDYNIEFSSPDEQSCSVSTQIINADTDNDKINIINDNKKHNIIYNPIKKKVKKNKIYELELKDIIIIILATIIVVIFLGFLLF